MTKWISTVTLPNGVSIEGECEELDHLCRMPTCGDTAVRFVCPRYEDIEPLVLEDWCNNHVDAMICVSKKVSEERKKPRQRWWRPSTWRKKDWLGDNPLRLKR